MNAGKLIFSQLTDWIRSSFLIVSSEFDPSPTNLDRIKDVFRRTRILIVMMKAVDSTANIGQRIKGVKP
jgi:hypothetical protein